MKMRAFWVVDVTICNYASLTLLLFSFSFAYVARNGVLRALFTMSNR